MKTARVSMAWVLTALLGAVLTFHGTARSEATSVNMASEVLSGGGGSSHVNGLNFNAAAGYMCIQSCNQQWAQCEQSCNGDFDCSVGCDTAKANCISGCQRL
jgi:hypothetical protein